MEHGSPTKNGASYKSAMRPVKSYRILFTVLENQPAPTVRVLHIRNVAQRAIGEPEDSEA